MLTFKQDVLYRRDTLKWLAKEKNIAEQGAMFPLSEKMSDSISEDDFMESLLLQPLVWLRCRKGKKESLIEKLKSNQLPYIVSEILPEALGVPPRVNLQELGVPDNGWAEIQDHSSQQTLQAIAPKAGEKWYDACAASGGKSLLLLEKQPEVQLMVSDLRPAMLENLKERFRRNGIRTFDSFAADISIAGSLHRYQAFFDGIIADVPCSGSGTWGRTPDQMCSFTEEKLEHYVQLQRRIVEQLVTALKPGGKLVYITCSVYRNENEDQAAFIEKLPGMKKLHSGLIEGFRQRADTMYSAVFEKNGK